MQDQALITYYLGMTEEAVDDLDDEAYSQAAARARFLAEHERDLLVEAITIVLNKIGEGR